MTFFEDGPPIRNTDRQHLGQTQVEVLPRDPVDSESVEDLLEQALPPELERYQSLARVGLGGMGAVDEVIDRRLRRKTAMKILRDHLDGDPGSVRRFIREAQVTGQLEHPSIVPVHDLGRDHRGRLVFTMKLLEGRTLSELVWANRRNRFSLGFLFRFMEAFTKVCDAVAFAHAKGVIHCDIKMANVMVGSFGEVFLVDWGIAKIAGEDPPLPPPGSEGHAVIVGTPAYMAPEQARGEHDQVDNGTDIFLLGTMLYEMLTLRAPFDASSPVESIRMAQKCSWLPPNLVATEDLLPIELCRIVERAMAPEKAERYQTVGELKADVLSFMRGGFEFPELLKPAGAVIVSQDEEGDAAYIIVEGECQVRRRIGDKDIDVAILGAGEVFGETSILSQAPRTASVIAKTDVTLLMVKRELFDQEVGRMKPWMGSFIRTLANRFRSEAAASAEVAAGRSQQHVLHYCMMFAMTWGSLHEDGSMVASFAPLAAQLSAVFGISEDRVAEEVGALSEVEVDSSLDRVVFRQPEKTLNRVRRRLGF